MSEAEVHLDSRRQIRSLPEEAESSAHDGLLRIRQTRATAQGESADAELVERLRRKQPLHSDRAYSNRDL